MRRILRGEQPFSALNCAVSFRPKFTLIRAFNRIKIRIFQRRDVIAVIPVDARLVYCAPIAVAPVIPSIFSVSVSLFTRFIAAFDFWKHFSDRFRYAYRGRFGVCPAARVTGLSISSYTHATGEEMENEQFYSPGNSIVINTGRRRFVYTSMAY